METILQQRKFGNYDGISVIIPVLDEEENVSILLQQFLDIESDRRFKRIKEIIFIDDGSSDGTVNRIFSFSTRFKNIRLNVIMRRTKNGTVDAQLCGIKSASYENVIVMDGDLQHPVDSLPDIIEKFERNYDVVIASRYLRGGRARREPFNGLKSRIAAFMAKIIIPSARELTDPISGFFMFNRNIMDCNVEIKNANKLLLLVLAKTSGVSIGEVPFQFSERVNGNSKVAAGFKKYIVRYARELKEYRKLIKQGFESQPNKSKLAEQTHQ